MNIWLHLTFVGLCFLLGVLVFIDKVRREWAKVEFSGRKPFWWWFHKILCEVGWSARNFGWKMYYYHLNKLCNYGYNLYGKPIKK